MNANTPENPARKGPCKKRDLFSVASHLGVVQEPFSALQVEVLLKSKINAEATCPKMRGGAGDGGAMGECLQCVIPHCD